MNPTSRQHKKSQRAVLWCWILLNLGGYLAVTVSQSDLTPLIYITYFPVAVFVIWTQALVMSQLLPPPSPQLEKFKTVLTIGSCIYFPAAMCAITILAKEGSSGSAAESTPLNTFFSYIAIAVAAITWSVIFAFEVILRRSTSAAHNS